MGVTRSTFERWRYKRTAPRIYRLPSGTLRFELSDVENWRESLAVESPRALRLHEDRGLWGLEQANSSEALQVSCSQTVPSKSTRQSRRPPLRAAFLFQPAPMSGKVRCLLYQGFRSTQVCPRQARKWRGSARARSGQDCPHLTTSTKSPLPPGSSREPSCGR